MYRRGDGRTHSDSPPFEADCTRAYESGGGGGGTSGMERRKHSHIYIYMCVCVARYRQSLNSLRVHSIFRTLGSLSLYTIMWSLTRARFFFHLLVI